MAEVVDLDSSSDFGIEIPPHLQNVDGPIYNPTVRPHAEFNAAEDAKKLRKAVRLAGTNENEIITVLGNRTNLQRQEIIKEYKREYGRDLITDIKSDLSFNFKQLCEALLLLPEQFDAKELRQAMKFPGTRESVLIEIICFRNGSQLEKISQSYQEEFKRDLKEDIISETSKSFRELLVSCLDANRAASDLKVDHSQAKTDAQRLLNAGDGKLGTDKAVFTEVFSERSFTHLWAVFKHYDKISKRGIEATLKREWQVRGDYLRSLQATVFAARESHVFFARKLLAAMDRAGTDDRTLKRIVVMRSERDLKEISAHFDRNPGEFKKSLSEWVSEDTSGDYRKMLLMLLTD